MMYGKLCAFIEHHGKEIPGLSLNLFLLVLLKSGHLIFSCNHFLSFVNFVKLPKLQQIIITIKPTVLLNGHADKATTHL